MVQEAAATFVAEETMEVRYKPAGSFLNAVGELADFVEQRGLFPHWTIESNVVQFRDGEKQAKNLSAFVSFRNAGYVSLDAPTANFFADKATSFLAQVYENPHFKIPKIQRVGVRNRCFVKSSHSFEHIDQRLFQVLFRDDFSSIFEANRVDQSAIFEMTTGDTSIRLFIGPLRSNEAPKHFGFQSDHFVSAGLIVDIDTFSLTERSPTSAIAFIRKNALVAWDRIFKLQALLDA
jgi:hypothetical protein